MGIKRTVLIDEPFPDLFCGLCQEILDDPVQVRCPEDHMFCNSCIENYLQQSRTCPHCLTDLDPSLFQPSKFVQRQIGRLRVRCIYHESGCTWQGILSDTHPNECSFELSECPNTKHGCKERLRRMDIQQHKCPFELLTCPNMMPLCKPFFRKDKEIHERSCRSYPCPFAIQGCTFIGTLMDVNIHCDMYCGKLHQRIKELEVECNRLNKCITECNGGNCKELIQQHQHISTNTTNTTTTQSNTNPTTPSTTTTTTTSKKDTTKDDEDMGGIDLLEQMLSNNNDYLSLGLLNNDNNNTINNKSSNESSSQQQGSNTPQHNKQQPLINSLLSGGAGANDLMDISDSLLPLPFMPSIDSNKQQPSTAAAAAPKRSSNGKIIRYSKNTRLAHSAMRIKRQQQNRYYYFSDMNPFESLLEDLDVAIKPDFQYLQQSTSQPSQEEDVSTPMSQTVATPASIISASSQQDDISNMMAQHTLSSPQNNPFSFNNLDDVQKYLSDMTSSQQQPHSTLTTEDNTVTSPAYTTPPTTANTNTTNTMNSSSITNPSSSIATPVQSSPLRNSNSNKTNKSRNKGDTKDNNKKTKKSTMIDVRSPPQQQQQQQQPSSPNNINSNNASSPTPSDTPKKRPMFVLASSYLSNYGNNNKQQQQQQQASTSSSSSSS
ncbi:hypothetical protein INT45_005848 [Circinella minor]|uniref:Uncharacterized protein n=1 Tax=Circinella minor TaxID=1195481 RepID=A0A8H7VIG4_9FUNG|nr:hypothetical protein INT45_005848 [Circinella minor]